jgi:hypothetical protein
MEKSSSTSKAPSLFNNPGIKQAWDKLSEEDKAKFKARGKEMYEGVDFESGVIEDQVIVDPVANIQCALRSGMHPMYLEKSEKDLMTEAYGEKWYERFGANKLEMM